MPNPNDLIAEHLFFVPPNEKTTDEATGKAAGSRAVEESEASDNKNAQESPADTNIGCYDASDALNYSI